MSEHEPARTPETRPATDPLMPDWRRLEIAARRFGPMIADGIAQALAGGTEIDHETARCVAHVLGRAYGRESALATFGRTGEGDYLKLRDEYLALYADERADAVTKETIDWLGTHLVARDRTGSGRRFTNELLPPKLERLLVRTELRVGGPRFVVQVPANWDSGGIDRLTETLAELRLPEDPALQAFLSLPDVNAGTADIVASFQEAYAGSFATEEDALRALSPLKEWEEQLADWCIDNGVDAEALDWNFAPLLERLRTVYDLVELEGTHHAFIK